MSLHESCGIFGVYAPKEDVARLTFFALFALQHRGQESSGIATTSGNGLFLHTGMGLVSHVFDEAALARLPGTIAIGHNRYSTAGSSRLANAQPIVIQTPEGQLALAHNGNIINAVPLRQELEDREAASSPRPTRRSSPISLCLLPVTAWKRRSAAP